MLQRTLAIDASEADRLLLVVDKYHQVSCLQSSARVTFACDLPASMTAVEFFSCFECRTPRNLTAVSCSDQPVLCAFLMPSLSEMKKKKLGLYFVFETVLR